MQVASENPSRLLNERDLDDYLGRLPWERLIGVASPFFQNSRPAASEFLRTIQAEARLGLRLIAASVPAGGRILEVGSGMGLLAGFLRSKGLDVTALEPGLGGFGVSAALARAVQDCTEFAGLTRLDAPAEKLSPQMHGRFDFIYSVNVLEHIPCLEVALDAMGRVLTENGEMLHTCPNYFVPYEPHFGVALIPFFPRWTAPFVRRNGLDELWDSLNFITAQQVRRICRRNALEVVFHPEVLYRAFLRLEQDPEFLKRQSNVLVVGTFRLLKATGLLRALRLLPAELATPMIFSIKHRTVEPES